MSKPNNKGTLDHLEAGPIDREVLLTEPTIQQTSSGDPYLEATVQDTSRSLRLVQWDRDEAPEPGVYRVRGAAEEYKGSLQVKATDLEPGDKAPGRFLETANQNPEELKDSIQTALGDLGDPYKAPTTNVLSGDLLDAFVRAPAARQYHHAYQGGLAEHTLSVHRVAQCVSRHYTTHEHYDIDRDLVLAGVLLHDVGKAVCYERQDYAWQKSQTGKLVGHIPWAMAEIRDACMATLTDDDVCQRLQHVVAAHHGEKAKGSPVEPKCAEAELVARFDGLDAAVTQFEEAEDGEWSQPLGVEVCKV